MYADSELFFICYDAFLINFEKFVVKHVFYCVPERN